MPGIALDSLSEDELELGLIILLTIVTVASAARIVPPLFRFLFDRLQWSTKTYAEVIEPHQKLLAIAIALSDVDLLLLFRSSSKFYAVVDVPLSLAVCASVVWLIFKLSRQFFDVYLLNAAVRDGRKISSEILTLGKVTTVVGGAVIVVLIFGQTHQVNVVGLVASLGVGGLRSTKDSRAGGETKHRCTVWHRPWQYQN
ncbi:MAG: hypothetical protein AAFU53_15315 [Cyanobacteria bacterium J06632_3]